MYAVREIAHPTTMLGGTRLKDPKSLLRFSALPGTLACQITGNIMFSIQDRRGAHTGGSFHILQLSSA